MATAIDREAAGLQVLVEGLPDRQVSAAASPGGPRHQQHLLPAMIRQGVHAPVEIGKREVRRLQRPQRAGPLGGPGAQHPDLSRGIAHHRMADVPPEGGDVDRVARMTSASRPRGAGTQASSRQSPRPERPARRPVDVGARQPETLADDARRGDLRFPTPWMTVTIVPPPIGVAGIGLVPHSGRRAPCGTSDRVARVRARQSGSSRPSARPDSFAPGCYDRLRARTLARAPAVSLRRPRADHGRADREQPRGARSARAGPLAPRRPRPHATGGGLVPVGLLRRGGADVVSRGLARGSHRRALDAPGRPGARRRLLRPDGPRARLPEPPGAGHAGGRRLRRRRSHLHQGRPRVVPGAEPRHGRRREAGGIPPGRRAGRARAPTLAIRASLGWRGALAVAAGVIPCPPRRWASGTASRRGNPPTRAAAARGPRPRVVLASRPIWLVSWRPSCTRRSRCRGSATRRSTSPRSWGSRSSAPARCSGSPRAAGSSAAWASASSRTACSADGG